MITAISSVRQNGSLSNNVNLKKANQVAFTGNPLNLLKADETIRPISNLLKRILGKAELPFSKKPLLANADIIHFGPDGMPIVIHAPEMHTATTKILDGSNILRPDAADLASNATDALTTKAALADVLSGTSHASDAIDAVSHGANVVDAIATKADIIDTIATAADHKSVVAGLIDGAMHIIDKLPL